MGSPWFNPYEQWLGIPVSEQPADYYHLLGLKRFEDNRAEIEQAAATRLAIVRRYENSAYADIAKQLQKEILSARACLLNPATKASYDAQLRKQLADDYLGSTLANSGGQLPLDVASEPVTTSAVLPKRRKSSQGAWIQIVQIVLGGIAGVLLAVAILWFGFGIDLLGLGLDSATKARKSQVATAKSSGSRPSQNSLKKPRNSTKPADHENGEVTHPSPTNNDDQTRQLPPPGSANAPPAGIPETCSKAGHAFRYLGRRSTRADLTWRVFICLKCGEFWEYPEMEGEDKAAAFNKHFKLATLLPCPGRRFSSSEQLLRYLGIDSSKEINVAGHCWVPVIVTRGRQGFHPVGCHLLTWTCKNCGAKLGIAFPVIRFDRDSPVEKLVRQVGPKSACTVRTVR